METVPPGGPSLTIDTLGQASSLDQLGAFGAQIEGGPPGAAPGAAPGGQVAAGMPNPLVLQNAQTILGVVMALRDGFTHFTKLKAPAAIATNQALRDLAAGWGEWTAKRNYDLKALMGEHADTVPLVISTLALAWAVYEGTKSELALRKPVDAKDKRADEAPAAPPEQPQNTEASNVAVFPGQGRPS